ncbi:Bifunctional protein PutA [Planctopirus ephydatiae]|uniref:L-glutamate gamma-semialdehyde dehydrogenase n=1 Tax=Planctopirus ephydatiae TaxID=2528019 RepID=A0A518GPN7_9PLAN|nr:bifunctional proline dehydrogenase/L-glutamate gamma-semialdehyde dehydrogenase [Planctopirus ephydatiae]QDV30588.1 Bifunctional protein PutA [Planctopirus ephydatiae]
MKTLTPPDFSVNLIDSASFMESVTQRAEQLLVKSRLAQTSAEKKAAQNVAGMMNDRAGKSLTLAMVDEVFRSHQPARQAQRWQSALDRFGIPGYLPWIDRCLMQMGSLASRIAPGIVMPLVTSRLQSESSNVILDATPSELKRHFATRQSEGFRCNLNHLGEAILGEEEAQHRLKLILGYLANPLVDYVSVKITAIFSQVNIVAWKETRSEICERLRTIFRAALPQGKFVNLDMEEYRDLAITIEAFQTVLDEPEFRQLSAGIVLQAYLPDSFTAQKSLTAWARKRVESGGKDIKVRLVKGANLAMEQVEAELHGWNQAPYPTKADTDANFRRMLEYGCQPEHAEYVRLGVASHNLFDIALALELRERLGTADRVELEMLEGMANHQARVVRDEAYGLLLYSPVVQKADFFSAMSYLVRRLDENTAPENFLRAAFSLEPDSPTWHEQKQRFADGWNHRTTVSALSRRIEPRHDPQTMSTFENEPDSDWTQPNVREQLNQAIANWSNPALPPIAELDLVLDQAVVAQPAWESRAIEERREILKSASKVMRQDRFRTIACMQREAKKAIWEADAEISEAIDFARYYAMEFETPASLKAQALGVVVVTPPWNFPYAIPAGGVLAALMAGCSVILKPAPETAATAYLLASQLWEAGVPRDVLQFFPCEDGETGKALITDSRVAAVVLTGGWETAQMFRNWRPTLRLYAETSGKNAMVITAQADRELAIKDLVKSAFGHSGQKCSAASLAIVDQEIYHDPAFRRQLRDAASSLFVGPATDRRSIVTPLIRPASPALHRALTILEPGEEWLLEPVQSPQDPCLWSPGIKLGVKPGSWFHLTECFGPVLGIMCSTTLDEAIKWQNATSFGLTAGLHTLDKEEQVYWKDRVQAGNVYINRSTTGAIVRRQPFGGWKRSSIGPGAKAGGPNYSHLFTRLTDRNSFVSPVEIGHSYQKAWNQQFSLSHDPSKLHCERNEFRYCPSRGVILRVGICDEIAASQAIERAQLVARITGVRLIISDSKIESEVDFLTSLAVLAGQAEFLRIVGAVSEAVFKAAADLDLNWIDAPLTAHGPTELRYWLREQSVSQTRHRYGLITD